MIDKKFIGHEFPTRTITVERGQLKLFCKAIGETNPIFLDEDAAKAAGYEGIPVPPTFPMSLTMLAEPADYDIYAKMGADKTRLLHGEQGFAYHAPIYVGDHLMIDTRIDDIVEKKGGALELITYVTKVVNQRGEHVADLRSVTVLRN